MDNDNLDLLCMMDRIASRAGFDNVDTWALAQLNDFVSVAESWRELREGIL
jgi:hypothetical protein